MVHILHPFGSFGAKTSGFKPFSRNGKSLPVDFQSVKRDGHPSYDNGLLLHHNLDGAEQPLALR
jgi:hypothetical protein